MRNPQTSASGAARTVAAIFLAGFAISVLMLWRSQVAGDQLNLLARGWLLVDEGRWIPYGNPMSTGGKSPGGITSLLVGLPLFLWRDHRAPSALVLLFHLGAYLLLDRTLRRILSPRERVLLALLYWLNPWRLYFSAFLWNPNYLFLFGALHLWSSLRQHTESHFWASFVHALCLGLAVQIHASTLLLAVASLLLWWRGYFKAHWTGLFLGGALAALPLIPWAIDLAANPTILTEADKGFPGRGLLLVFPLVRGLLYWLRYASLAVPERIATLQFADLLGTDPWLGRSLTIVFRTLPAVTLLGALLANARLLRRGARWLTRQARPDLGAHSWLKGYAVLCLTAAVIVFSLSPTTIMMWQGLILFHAAILPVILWGGSLARSRRAGWLATGVPLYTVVNLALLVGIALGAPQYRCSGHTGADGFGFPLRYDHRMLHELRIQATCPWPLNDPQGWWPDVLPAGATTDP
jgi:hypothetical protein